MAVAAGRESAEYRRLSGRQPSIPTDEQRQAAFTRLAELDIEIERAFLAVRETSDALVAQVSLPRHKLETGRAPLDPRACIVAVPSDEETA